MASIKSEWTCALHGSGKAWKRHLSDTFQYIVPSYCYNKTDDSRFG